MREYCIFLIDYNMENNFLFVIFTDMDFTNLKVFGLINFRKIILYF
jgi:hypothetical protein